jgi:hypothetical protein
MADVAGPLNKRKHHRTMAEKPPPRNKWTDEWAGVSVEHLNPIDLLQFAARFRSSVLHCHSESVLTRISLVFDSLSFSLSCLVGRLVKGIRLSICIPEGGRREGEQAKGELFGFI